MKTRTRAEYLAQAAAPFPWLGPTATDDLVNLVAAELGHAEILDDFRPHGAHFAKAVPAANILHVLSGNTPAAALQSLIRGLLLGAHNLAKLPSAGLPEVEHFRELLPRELSARLELATALTDEWVGRADAVIVFGHDETIAELRRRIPTDKVFVAHGHKFSFGVVWDDPAFESVAGAARDASLFDQQGCLSPHVFYIRGDARAYAEQLARAMDRFAENEPRSALSISESLAIRTRRDDLQFRAANGDPIRLWSSAHGTGWTVVFDATPGFPVSPLNRFVFVKPLPDDLSPELHEVRSNLSCAGIWPAVMENARTLTTLGVTRICPIGRMQAPPWSWHQDGLAPLSALVRWIDFEFERA